MTAVWQSVGGGFGSWCRRSNVFWNLLLLGGIALRAQRPIVIKLSRGRSVCRSVQCIVENGGSDQVQGWGRWWGFGIGPREGVLLAANLGCAIVNNGDFTVYVCDTAAMRPSSQITLDRLVAIFVIHCYRYCYYCLCIWKNRCHSIAKLYLNIAHWLDRPVSSPDITYSILLERTSVEFCSRSSVANVLTFNLRLKLTFHLFDLL